MLADHLPDVSGFVRSRLTSLKYGDIPLQDLTICQILSRELDQYSGLSSLVTAALQLQERGKTLRME